MASELDRHLHEIMDRFTAPGGPLETEPFDCGGVTVPVIKAAPPTLSALFAHFCHQHGDAEFLVDGDVRLTFAETHALALRAAHGLILRLGVGRGERVGIAARNSAGWIIAYMGVLIAGGCATLLNGWWTGEELAGGIDLAECKLVLADPQRAARLEGRDTGARIVVIEHGDPETGLAPILAGADEKAEIPALTGDDLATILFTSGSTGASRGVWSDHRRVTQATVNYAGQALMVLTAMTERKEPVEPHQIGLLNLPLFHVTAEVPMLLVSFVTGRKLVLLNKWDPVEAMRLIERERVTYFLGVPLMSFEVASHPRRGEFDLSTCTIFAAGGAPRPVEHVGRIRAAFPQAYPLLGYGLTETNGAICGNFNENYLAKPDSTGPACRPLADIVILGDAGEVLPANRMGEIAVRSIMNFNGYWRNTEATAAVFTPDGYFLTGDLGYLDEDGYVFIVDRKKEIIIRGGENISCIEVEQAIYAHPAVAEASVFGLPDERLGEVPVAVFFAKQGHSVDSDELAGFLGERLARFKVPVRIWREREPLPRLGTEKVDKRSLKARYSQDWDAATGGA